MNVLKRPLTSDEIGIKADSDGYITAVVYVSNHEWNDLSDEEFDLLLSRKITATDLMSDITYKKIQDNDNGVYLEVSGDVVAIIDYNDCDEQCHVKKTKFRYRQN